MLRLLLCLLLQLQLRSVLATAPLLQCDFARTLMYDGTFITEDMENEAFYQDDFVDRFVDMVYMHVYVVCIGTYIIVVSSSVK